MTQPYSTRQHRLPTVPQNIPPELRKWALDLTRTLAQILLERRGGVATSTLDGLVSFLNAADGSVDRLLEARERIAVVTPTEDSDAD